MTSYSLPAASSRQEAARRLAAITTLLEGGGDSSMKHVAREVGWSRQWLYAQAGRVVHEVLPRRPGRPAGRDEASEREARIASLEQEIGELRSRVLELEACNENTVEVSAERRERFALAAVGRGVSVRGIEELSGVAFGEERRLTKSVVQRCIANHGETAVRLMASVRDQVGAKLWCLAADDIFFNGHDVKAVMEPYSAAVISLGRWDGVQGEDWALWLMEFERLELLVSDLGSDLLSAATMLGVDHSADLFHEARIFERDWLTPLLEEASRQEAYWWLVLESVTNPNALAFDDDANADEHAGLRVASTRLRTAENDFYAAVAVIDLIRTLYRPIDPATGRLWDTPAVERVLGEIDAMARTIVHKTVGPRILRHLRTHGHRFAAHRRLFDHIEVPLAETTTWTSRQVLNGVLALRRLRRQLYDPQAQGGWKDTWRLARDLERRLRAACPDLDAVEQRLLEELRVIRRSSSLVESFNSRLRVLQTVHRNVDDRLLALAAVRWNLTPATRRGRAPRTTPYQILGLDFDATRPWFDVLIQETRERLQNAA